MPKKNELSYLGLRIKHLTSEHHGKDGYRVECNGRDFPTLRDARIHILCLCGYGSMKGAT